MRKIAVSFCGGCDPVFDIMDFWKRIRDIIGERIIWMAIGDGDYDAVLIINGCSRKCRENELAGVESKRVISIKNDENNLERLAIELLGRF